VGIQDKTATNFGTTCRYLEKFIDWNTNTQSWGFKL